MSGNGEAEGQVLEVDSVQFLVLTGILGIVVILVLYIKNAVTEASRKEAKNESNGVETEKPTASATGGSKKKIREKMVHKRDQKHTFAHAWLSSSLKGHSQDVLQIDFSINGRYLASCSEDRTVLIWTVKDFDQKEHKSLRANVELDHAMHVRFSPDSKAFVTTLANKNAVRIFKIGRKDDGSLGNITALEDDFAAKHSAIIIGLGISCTGRFIFTASDDTTLIVWSLKGEVLATIDTHQMNNKYAIVSPCGRFIASAGFTPDVKVWEVSFAKNGDFKEVVRAFELKGHSAGVYSFAFNLDSTRMASVSKDGTWKLWDTNIEYVKGQEPYLLLTTTLPEDVAGKPCLIALSPDALTVVVAAGTSLYVFNTTDGGLTETMHEVHSAPITALSFSLNNKYFVSAGDRHIRVFHNVHGYRASIAALKKTLSKASSQTHKQRIEDEIKEARDRLAAILGN